MKCSKKCVNSTDRLKKFPLIIVRLILDTICKINVDQRPETAMQSVAEPETNYRNP